MSKAEVTARAAGSPLSIGQESIWFLHRIAPDSPAYNLAFAFRIRADLDVDALTRAWRLVARRHDQLRSAYPERDGQARRVLAEPDALTVDIRDVPGIPEPELNALMQAVSDEPFTLDAAPPVRLTLFRRAPDDTVILLGAHHVVLDAASQVVVVTDLLLAYQAVRAGEEPDWPARDWTYADHVAAEAALLAGPRGAESLAFWREFTANAPLALELPTDRPRPPAQRYVGSGHAIPVPVARLHRLQEAARGVRATPFVFLVSAFEAVLHRYSGQRDFLVGCAASTRDRNLRDVVGFFVNPVLLRPRFTDRTTFRELAEATGAQVRLTMAHREYPFALLTRELGVPRDPSRAPMFQVMVSAITASSADPLLRLLMDHETTGEPMVFAGLPLDIVDLPVHQAGQFDLTLELHMSRHYLTLVLKYASDLFDHATVVRMGDHLLALIDAAIDAPDEPIARLPMLTESERLALAGAGPIGDDPEW